MDIILYNFVLQCSLLHQGAGLRVNLLNTEHTALEVM